MKAVNEKPWLDHSNNILSDEALKEAGRSWSAETWDAFLKDTVTKNASRNEVSPAYLEEACERDNRLWDSTSSSIPSEVRTELVEAIGRLPKRSRQVIRGTFWNDFSEREIAKWLKLSRNSVREIKARSLKKIRSLFQKTLPTHAYLIEGSKVSTQKHRSKHEQVLEVYGADLRGSFLV